MSAWVGHLSPQTNEHFQFVNTCIVILRREYVHTTVSHRPELGTLNFFYYYLYE